MLTHRNRNTHRQDEPAGQLVFVHLHIVNGVREVRIMQIGGQNVNLDPSEAGVHSVGGRYVQHRLVFFRKILHINERDDARHRIDVVRLLFVALRYAVRQVVVVYVVRIAGRNNGHELAAGGMLGQGTAVRWLLEFRRIVVHVVDWMMA